MTSARCPYCLAPESGGGRPACLCAVSAPDDFEPLRLRPYVRLPDPEEPAPGPALPPVAPPPAPGWRPPGVPAGPAPPGDARPPLAALPDLRGLRGVRPVARAGAGRRARPGAAGPTSRTVRCPEPGAEVPAPPGARPGKRAVPTVLAMAGTAVAVTAGLLSGEPFADRRDRATPPADDTAVPAAEDTARDDDRAPADALPPSRSTSRAASPGPLPDAAASAPGAWHPRPPAHATAAPPVPATLREGATGRRVTELQLRLRELGIFTTPVDGYYGAGVRDAVARYQARYGVPDDLRGVYGPATRASLESHTYGP
ncbi:peptidoglycan-binding protein [Streptomyces sp. NPDC014733]|uniref:peptidoglycan-binding domain-containing protein n=1 Tax=Streptomyces sp. NPDC014733 TaxID=3364885 RepID=UPI0036FBB769